MPNLIITSWQKIICFTPFEHTALLASGIQSVSKENLESDTLIYLQL